MPQNLTSPDGMTGIWINLLFGFSSAVLLLVAYAYITRWRLRALQQLPLRGSPRWGALWPLLSTWRALTRRASISCPSPRRCCVGVWITVLASLAGLLMLFSDVASSVWGGLWYAALPGFAHDLVWYLLWFNTSLLGFMIWLRGARLDHADIHVGTRVQQALYSLVIVMLAWSGVAWLADTLDLRQLVTLTGWPLPMLIYQPLGLVIAGTALMLASRRTLVSIGDDAGWPDAFQWQQAGAMFAWLHLAEFLQEVLIAGLLITIFMGGARGPGAREGMVWFLAKLCLLVPAIVWFDECWLKPQQRLGRQLNPWLGGIALVNAAVTAALLWWRQMT